MHAETRNFVNDLIMEIQERYNYSLLATEGENPEDKSFRLGSNFSYYDVLEIIQSQLNVFGFIMEEKGPIAPVLGEKIKKNR